MILIDLHAVTDTVKTNPTLNHATCVVYPNQRFAFTTSETNGLPRLNFHFAHIYVLVKENKSPPTLLKLPVSKPTNIWPRPVVKKDFTCASDATLTTSSVSTKCFPVPVPIDFKPVCVVLSVNQKVCVLV